MRSAVPILDIDPFWDQWLAEPYARHDQLHAAGAVFFIPKYEIFGMARYEEVNATLRNPQDFCSGRSVGLEQIVDPNKHWRPPSLLLETDPPLHDLTRSVVNRVVNVAALESLRAIWKTTAEEMIPSLCTKGRIDAVPELAEAFPIKVFGDAVGIGPGGRGNLLALGSLALEVVGPRTERVERALAEAGMLTAWSTAASQRSALAPGGFGLNIYAAVDRGEITESQAALLVRSLLSAGVDTTVSGIGAALHAFATNPAQWSVLRSRPELAKSALDEVLRWDSVVQCFFRTTTRDVQVAGVDIPNESKIMLFFAAANGIRTGGRTLTNSTLPAVTQGSWALVPASMRVLVRWSPVSRWKQFCRRYSSTSVPSNSLARPDDA
ncbi:MAG TPA: hypothetical protein VGL34_15260 [Steroidobacteraceae bacterium]|jgi:hypothetical protein